MMYTMPKNLLSICVNFTLATQPLEIIRNEIRAVQQEVLLKLEIKSIAMLEYAPKQDSEAC